MQEWILGMPHQSSGVPLLNRRDTKEAFMRETKTTKTQSAVAKRAAAAIHSTSEAKPYFSQDGLRFLRGLARNNHRDWFNDRKFVYEAELKRPMLALIEAVTGAMMDFAPAHVRPAESTMLRIYRDTRFAKEKVPYKTHVSGWWVRDGLLKTSGAGYYLHVSGKEVVIAFGVYMPDAEQLLAIRRYLLEHHQEYRRLDASRTLRRLFPESEDGSPLSRSPKGFPAEHAGLDLIRQRRWGRSATLASEAATKPDFAKLVASYYRAAAPLVDLLNRPLVTSAEKRRRPLF
jgi:uncharacterized protein (TIGR02453 family)